MITTEKYPYLIDSPFLFQFFRLRNMEQFVKITILNFAEKPLQEVQGKILSGNLNLDGRSNMRRTANLTAFIDEKDVNYLAIGGLFAMNKKIKIEIGLLNETDQYINYPILWFPMGTYVIMSSSSSRNNSGTTVSLQLKDKMVFLNGEVGGTLPASVVFSEYEELDPETGTYVIKKPTIVQIIEELVHHYGGESPAKIIIGDLDKRVKQVMKWTKDTPLYSYRKQVTVEGYGKMNSYEYTLTQKPADDNTVEYDQTFYAGQDVGFIYNDFYFPGELIGDAGNSVCDILDKIKNTLGNFEYYYDLDGNFIFQEIKNYLNNSPKINEVIGEYVDSNTEVNTNTNPLILNQLDSQLTYTIPLKRGKALYSFDNCHDLILSYTNNPQYAQIKNDYIVWGARKTAAGETVPIRYHLAIDKKPTVGNTYTVLLVKEADPLIDDIYYAKVPVKYNTGKDFPAVGEPDRIYSYVKDSVEYFYYWNPEGTKITYENSITAPVTVLTEIVAGENEGETTTIYYTYYNQLKQIIDIEDKLNHNIHTNTNCIYRSLKNKKCYTYIQNEANAIRYDNENDIAKELFTYETKVDNGVTYYQTRYKETSEIGYKERKNITTRDWRSELYLAGAMSGVFGNDSNYYYTELVNEYPKLYDFVPVQGADNYCDQLKPEVAEMPESLDYFLDFIDTTAAIAEFSIDNIGRRTKVINDESINCIFERDIPDVILIPAGTDETNDLVEEAHGKQQVYTQLDANIYAGLTAGGHLNSAYNAVRDLLYEYTSYNESISIQMIPLFFLEPNIRIFVQDGESGIFGDYMINSISMTLDVNGTMSLSCSKALERI